MYSVIVYRQSSSVGFRGNVSKFKDEMLNDTQTGTYSMNKNLESTSRYSTPIIVIDFVSRHYSTYLFLHTLLELKRISFTSYNNNNNNNEKKKFFFLVENLSYVKLL